MEKDYKIAEHRIRIEGDELISAVKRIEGFAPFEVPVEDAPLVIFSITTEEAPVMTKPQYNSKIDEISNVFGRYERGYMFTTTPLGESALQIWQEDGSNRIYFQGSFFSTRLLRFTLWIAFGMATVPHETIAIHTSTIQYRNSCVLFLGESGTGKSTHTRLWKENIVDSILLNDDSPILRIIDHEPRIFGSPWSGKTPCYKNEDYPLVACVRLSQAPYNKIKKLSILESYGALHPSCPPDFAYDDNLYDHISLTLDKVLSYVPVYHLACLPNAEAAKLSCKTIFGE